MKIVLRPHLKIRLKEREIPQSYPKKIISNPDSKYMDTTTSHFIAVKQLEYGRKVRPMAVSYDIIDKEIQIITIHPISKQEIKNKITRGRWKDYEEE